VKLAAPQIQSTPVPVTLIPRTVAVATATSKPVQQATKPVYIPAAGFPMSCPAGTIPHRTGSMTTKCKPAGEARKSCPFPTVPLLKKQSGSSVFYVCADRATIPGKIAAYFPNEKRWRTASLKATPAARPGLDGLGQADYQEETSTPAKPTDASEVSWEDFLETVESTKEIEALTPPPPPPPKESSRPRWLVPALIGGGLLAAGVIAVAVIRR
jgi:hypothetical protein